MIRKNRGLVKKNDMLSQFTYEGNLFLWEY